LSLPTISSTSFRTMASRPDSVASDFTKAINTPLPPQYDDVFQDPPNLPQNLFQDSPDLSLDPPRASFFASELSTHRDSSYAQSTPNYSTQILPVAVADKNERDEIANDDAQAPPIKRRSPLLLLLVGAAVLIVVVLIVVLPVYFTVIKPNHRNVHSSASTGAGSSGPAGTPNTGNPQSPTGATSGGDGSTIILDDGTNFTYSNKFGGYCEYPSFFYNTIEIRDCSDRVKTFRSIS